MQLNQEDQLYIDELYNDLKENSVGDEQQIVHVAKVSNNAQVRESERPQEKRPATFKNLGKQGLQGFFKDLIGMKTPLPRPVTYLPKPTEPWVPLKDLRKNRTPLPKPCLLYTSDAADE